MVSELKYFKCTCDFKKSITLDVASGQNCSVANRYSLRPRGSAPGVSVGHTCIFTPSEDGGKGRLLIIGGANPSGSFSDSHIINLGKKINK